MAGNSASASYAFKYDATAPTVSATRAARPTTTAGTTPPSRSATAARTRRAASTAATPTTSTTGRTRPVTRSAAAAPTWPATRPAPPMASCTTRRADRGRQPRPRSRSQRLVQRAGRLQRRRLGRDERACRRDADGLYNGPDGEDVSASLTCRDNAGNEGEGSVSFDYDNTDPGVVVSLARDPDHNGWYNAPVGYTRRLGRDERGRLLPGRSGLQRPRRRPGHRHAPARTTPGTKAWAHEASSTTRRRRRWSRR